MKMRLQHFLLSKSLEADFWKQELELYRRLCYLKRKLK